MSFPSSPSLKRGVDRPCRFLDICSASKPVRQRDEEPVSPIYVMGGQAVRFLSSAAVMTADVAQRKSRSSTASPISSPPACRRCRGSARPTRTSKDYRAAPATPRSRRSTICLKSPNDTFTSQQFQYWIALNLMLYAPRSLQGRRRLDRPAQRALSAGGEIHQRHSQQSRHRRSLRIRHRREHDHVSDPAHRREARRGNAAAMSAYAAEISFPSLSGLVEYNKEPAAIESIAMPIAIINA